MVRIFFAIIIIFAVVFISYCMGNKKADNLAIYLIFALIGIRTSFTVIPVNFEGTHYLQSTWIIYLTDFPIIYLITRWIRKKRFNEFHSKTFKFVLMYFFVAVLSILVATNKYTSFWGAMNLIKFVAIFIIFTDYISIRENRYCIINGIMTAVIFQAVVAILQRISGGTIGLSMLGEVDTAFRTRIVNGEISSGVAGTFAHSSDLAVLMLFGLTILFFNAKYINKLKLYIFLGIGLVVLLLAESRTMLALTVIVVIIGYLKLIKKKVRLWEFFMIIIVPMAALLFILIYIDQIYSMFIMSDAIDQVFNRLNQWLIGWNEIVKRPFLGYGINNYVDYMQLTYPGLSDTFYYSNPIHNIYLQIWFDVGIIGLICFILVIISSIISLSKNKIKDEMCIAGFVFVIVALVYGIDGWGMLKEPSTNMLWISLGLMNNQLIRFAKKR